MFFLDFLWSIIKSESDERSLNGFNFFWIFSNSESSLPPGAPEITFAFFFSSPTGVEYLLFGSSPLFPTEYQKIKSKSSPCY